MAEILNWNTTYSTADYPWSVVDVDSKEKVLSYIKKDSILCLEKEVFFENIRFFAACKLSAPTIQILVPELDNADDLFYETCSISEIENWIQKKIVKQHEVIPLKRLLEVLLPFVS